MANLIKNIIRFLKVGQIPEDEKYAPLATGVIESAEVDGCGTRLPKHVISLDIKPMSDLLADEFINLVSDELEVTPEVVKSDLTRMLTPLRPNLKCCIEYPYVETLYRDTYYSYFSKKHYPNSRDCFRISFFDESIDDRSFTESDEFECYGYIVLRPTSRRIIGYTFINPKAYISHDFQCCLCTKSISVNGLLFKVNGFPFCGQDAESMTCSEVSLVMMMDYFSMRYPSYSKLLPSTIKKILSRHSHQRQSPSMGLADDLIAHVLLKLGFGIRVYTVDDTAKGYDRDDIIALLKTYIYSGFPLITCTDSHAFLTIGIQNQGISIKDPEFVINDDNKYPYDLTRMPSDIKCFMVPLAEKTFVDAESINPWSVLQRLDNSLALKLDTKSWEKDNKYIAHTYLTTSRSFKAHIRKQHIPNADLFISIAMPRFIWITEIIEKSKKSEPDNNTFVDTLLIYDATGGNSSDSYFICGKVKDMFIYSAADGTPYHRKQYQIIQGADDQIRSFDRNLKGDHNSWQV